MRGVVALLLALSVVLFFSGAAWIRILYPDAPTNVEALKEWGHIIGVIVGGLMGYVVGHNNRP